MVVYVEETACGEDLCGRKLLVGGKCAWWEAVWSGGRGGTDRILHTMVSPNTIVVL